MPVLHAAILLAGALICAFGALFLFHAASSGGQTRPAAPHRIQLPRHPSPAPGNAAVVRLRNGNAISGVVIAAAGDTVVLQWQGGTVTLEKREIESVEWGKTLETPDGIALYWPYAQNPVFRLDNGNVIDGSVIELNEDFLVLREKVRHNGFIEYQVSKNRLRAIEFNPGRPEAIGSVSAALLSRFPRFGLYAPLVRPDTALRLLREGGSRPLAFSRLEGLFLKIAGLLRQN